MSQLENRKIETIQDNTKEMQLKHIFNSVSECGATSVNKILDASKNRRQKKKISI